MRTKKRIIKKNNQDPSIQEITNLYAELVKAEGTVLEKAIEIGGLLAEQKKNGGHGKFEKWVDDTFDFSSRSARRYMKLFKHKDEIGEEKSVGDAMKMINGKTVRPDRFRLTVKENSAKELVQKLSEKFGEKFLSELLEHIQLLTEESKQRD